MNTVTMDTFTASMETVIDTIISNEAYFCELDSAAGDGDFGSSLAKGFQGIRSEWDSLDTGDIGTFMKSCGGVLLEKCGGASGPIWGTAFRTAGRYAEGKTGMDIADIAGFFQALVTGVQKTGGAALGDKTLLDSLIPAAVSLKRSAESGEEICTAMKNAADAASAGAESTKEIPAHKGRASYLGARSIGHYDAGARAIAVILEGIHNRCGEE